MARCGWLTVLPLILLASAGCRHGGIPLINLLGINKPVVIALSTDSPLQAFDPFLPYEKLRSALQSKVGRDVALDFCLPIQVQPNMQWGINHLAVVSPWHYAQMSADGEFEVLAVPADEQGRIARRALLIVPADSSVQQISELAGKPVGFGPEGRSGGDRAALRYLEDHGVQRADVGHELLPVPGSLRHHRSGAELARDIRSGRTPAGFIDEAEWEALPETEERDGAPPRTAFRILGRTAAMPDMLVIRAPKLDADTAARVQAALLDVHRTHPDALRPLKITAYRRPTPELLADVKRLFDPELPAGDPRAGPVDPASE